MTNIIQSPDARSCEKWRLIYSFSSVLAGKHISGCVLRNMICQ